MNFQEYEKRIAELKKEGSAHGWALDFGDQKPIEFLKLDITEIVISDSAFHWKNTWKKEGKNWVQVPEIIDYKKNFIQMVGNQCGIESEPSVSEKTGKYSYLSKAVAFRMTPAGHKVYASDEYEFDAEVRAEEVILKNEVKYMEYQEKLASGKTVRDKDKATQKYGSEAKKRLAVVEMAKNGRSRASTGAQKRVIIKMLKLPAPSEKLIGSHMFCFQCIPDFGNPHVRDKYLSEGGSATAVFGEPQIKPAIQIEEPTLEFKIGEQKAKFSDHKALCKLTDMVIGRGTYLDEYYSFIMAYPEMSKEEKVSEIVNRLTDFEAVPDNIVSGDNVVKMAYLAEWGSK